MGVEQLVLQVFKGPSKRMAAKRRLDLALLTKPVAITAEFTVFS